MSKPGSGHRKGRWEYGRRVKSSGGPVPRKHKRKAWGESPQEQGAEKTMHILAPMPDRKTYGPFK